MKLKDIIKESYELKEKFFDYLLDMARKGGQYKDDSERSYVQSKLNNGEYRFTQHQIGNASTKDNEWICSFDDLGIVSIKKQSGGREVIMFKRQ